MNIHSPFETFDIGRKSFYADYAIQYHCYGTEITADKNFQEYFLFQTKYQSEIYINENSFFFRSTRVSQRHCRFNDESNLTHYDIYTQGLCIQECRINLVFSLCQCIPHFYPNRSKFWFSLNNLNFSSRID